MEFLPQQTAVQNEGDLPQLIAEAVHQSRFIVVRHAQTREFPMTPEINFVPRMIALSHYAWYSLAKQGPYELDYMAGTFRGLPIVVSASRESQEVWFHIL